MIDPGSSSSSAVGAVPSTATSTPPSPTGSPGPAPAESVMTLVDHLTELRSRLIRSVLAVVVGSAIGFVAAPALRAFLVAPLPEGRRVLIVLGPGDAFAITLRIAIAVG